MSDASAAWWIILPNVRARAAWLAAIAASAEASGLRMIDWDQGPDPAALVGGAVIVVTGQAEAAAAGASPDRTTVLLASAAPDLDVLAGDRHAALLHATQPMAAAQAAPAAVRIDDRALAGGLVELAPGLAVTPPPTPPLSPLARGLSLFGRPDVQVDWGPEYFAYDARNGPVASISGDIDLTGRARFLIYGPYIALPPGHWKAVFRLGFDRPGAQRRFRLDWGTQQAFDSEEFVPGRAGLYEIEMDYVWTEPAPAEFRILVMEGVFDGRLTFGGVRVSRLPDAG